MYNEGISKVGDLLDLAVEMEIIDKRGSYYSYGESRLGQGRENTKEFLRANPDLAEEIEFQIREALMPDEIMPLDEE
jgi:recombination protein RecA